jgi:hypothetical protein
VSWTCRLWRGDYQGACNTVNPSDAERCSSCWRGREKSAFFQAVEEYERKQRRTDAGWPRLE